MSSGFTAVAIVHFNETVSGTNPLNWYFHCLGTSVTLSVESRNVAFLLQWGTLLLSLVLRILSPL